jgi:hypothetical protein
MTGINFLPVEIERLFGAQRVHAKFKRFSLSLPPA